MQADLANVPSESSGAVMVLAVNIVGNSPANGNEAGSWRDGQKPSFRKKHVDNVVKAHARFAAQHATGRVKTKNAVKSPAVDQFASCAETGITVTPPLPIREQRTRRGTPENLRYLIVPRGLVNVRVRGFRIAAPRSNPGDGRRGNG